MEYDRNHQNEKREMEEVKKRAEEKEYKNILLADHSKKIDSDNKELLNEIKLLKEKIMLSESGYNTLLEEKNSVIMSFIL